MTKKKVTEQYADIFFPNVNMYLCKCTKKWKHMLLGKGVKAGGYQKRTFKFYCKHSHVVLILNNVTVFPFLVLLTTVLQKWKSCSNQNQYTHYRSSVTSSLPFRPLFFLHLHHTLFPPHHTPFHVANFFLQKTSLTSPLSLLGDGGRRVAVLRYYTNIIKKAPVLRSRWGKSRQVDSLV